MNNKIFGQGFHHIIPSFFNTLIKLKDEKRKFELTFRTFGHDHNALIYEFNLFC